MARAKSVGSMTAAVFGMVTALAVAVCLLPSAAQAASPVANPDGVLPSQVARLLASDGAATDRLGSSIAVSGDMMVVGAPYADVAGKADAGAVYVFTRQGSTWGNEVRLVADDGGAGDRFGDSVAIDGGTVIVGAPYADVAGKADAGAAYAFARPLADWIQQGKLVAPDSVASDWLGDSVAISGDTAILSAPGVDVPGKSGVGAAYPFVRSGTSWAAQGPRLIDPTGLELDFLGSSVAISGDTAIVGARWADLPGKANAGAALVYLRSGTTWTQQQKLISTDEAAGDSLGASVAISGNTAVIGACYASLPGKASAGAAYVFTRSDTSWSQQAKLISTDGAAGDWFGSSLVISGGTVLIGAPYADVPGKANGGAAYTFTGLGASWTQQVKCYGSSGVAEDNLGSAVGLTGGTIIAGAPYADVPGKADVGSVRVFAPYTTPEDTSLIVAAPGVLDNDVDADGNVLTAALSLAPAHGTVVLDPSGSFVYTPNPNWNGTDFFTYSAYDGTTYSSTAVVTIEVTPVGVPPVARPDGVLPSQVAKALAGDGAAGDNFGWSLDVSGDAMIVGASYADVSGKQDAGAAYVLARSWGTWGAPQKLINPDGAGIGDYFGTSVAIDGDTLVIGAPQADVVPNADQGSAFVYVRSGTDWVLQKKLTASDGAAGRPLRHRGGDRRGHDRRGRELRRRRR